MGGVKLPYLASPGLIPKILTKMQEARRPERFTQDFLETKLGHSGGSARAVIPLLKRMEFLSSDGTPTQLYDKFRNPSSMGAALAAGIRNAYKEVFDRNQYANDLARDKFKNMILEMTGLEKDNTVANLIVSTFWTLKTDADFDSSLTDFAEDKEISTVTENIANNREPAPAEKAIQRPSSSDLGVDFRVGYTINLNLPETTNVEVFNAIFRALNEHLLKRQ